MGNTPLFERVACFAKEALNASRLNVPRGIPFLSLFLSSPAPPLAPFVSNFSKLNRSGTKLVLIAKSHETTRAIARYKRYPLTRMRYYISAISRRGGSPPSADTFAMGGGGGGGTFLDNLLANMYINASIRRLNGRTIEERDKAEKCKLK